MITYDLYHISEDDFERLVVDICDNLLGLGIHSFAKGPDGGKDGYFEGTAQSYPSATAPWRGKFIIQAKHTSILNASCSDDSFFKNKSSVLNNEIARLAQMRNVKGQNFDNYLVFTNRKLTGNAQIEIKSFLQQGLGIQNADIIGQEDLIRYIEKQPELAKRYQLQKYLLPNQFYEADIRDVIVLFSQKNNWIDATPTSDPNPLEYADKQKKNALNNLDEDYFNDIKSHSLMFFQSIDKFLKDPRNAEYRKKYQNTTSDLRGYIQKHSGEHTFKEILESIIDNIVGADTQADIFKERTQARVFVHYMYWNCDIGRKQ
jgi:hypothetical protein